MAKYGARLVIDGDLLRKCIKGSGTNPYQVTLKLGHSSNCINQWCNRGRTYEVPFAEMIKAVFNEDDISLWLFDNTPLCRFNPGVSCAEEGRCCTRCGWNPLVQDERIKGRK